MSPLLRKGLAVGIILLFIGTAVIPPSGQTIGKASARGGHWLYVGGSGPGNYSKIQDAINDSTPGDTVYVYRGIYYEALQINVMNLSLIGEGKEVTTINASPVSSAIVIQQSYCLIQGFRIIASDDWLDEGIYILNNVDRTIIRNNNLSENGRGIFIGYTHNFHIIQNNLFYSNFYGLYFEEPFYDYTCWIQNNLFKDNEIGISTYGGRQLEISNNTFINCRQYGITTVSRDSTFKNNVFIGNKRGLEVYNSQKVIRNHFEDNDLGLTLLEAHDSLITQNNFIKNRRDVAFSEENLFTMNNWNGNYWGFSFHPKLIFGRRATSIPTLIQIGPWTSYYIIPWLNFDWHPAKEPFDISGV
jgi:nitrous oxidase accessory protein NosD